MLFELLLIGHLIGDFYIQTNKMAEEKNKNAKVILFHSIISGICLFASSWWIIDKTELFNYLGVILLMVAAHYIIDLFKISIQKSSKMKPEYAPMLLLVDQILHIITLAAVSYYNPYTIIDVDLTKWEPVVLLVICVLVCGKPAAVFIKELFKGFLKDDMVPDKSPKAGEYIGILEREMILLLGVMGQFGAIGFVLAAKSLARFKQLENQAFAEKYLVGTLLSAMIAIICVAIYQTV